MKSMKSSKKNDDLISNYGNWEQYNVTQTADLPKTPPSPSPHTHQSIIEEEEIPELEAGLSFTNGALPYDELEDGTPYISGSFNGWRY